jgi:putative transposase
MSKEVAAYVKEVFQQVAEDYEFVIDTMEVMEDHVHVFVVAPPKYSPAQFTPTCVENTPYSPLLIN